MRPSPSTRNDIEPAIYAKVEQHLERLKAEADKRRAAEELHEQELTKRAARQQEAEELRQRRQTEQGQTRGWGIGGARAVAKRSSALLASVAALFFAVAAYWYWSPFVAMHQLRTAAHERDAESFNDRVDYPRLRESLKGQFSAVMAEKMGGASEGGSDAARAGAALGALLGMSLVDRMVDAMVRPEAVMRGMQEGKFAPARGSDTAATEPSRATSWTSERRGVDKVIFHVKDEKGDSGKAVAIVLERSGFATWKLTEVRLPLK